MKLRVGKFASQLLLLIFTILSYSLLIVVFDKNWVGCNFLLENLLGYQKCTSIMGIHYLIVYHPHYPHPDTLLYTMMGYKFWEINVKLGVYEFASQHFRICETSILQLFKRGTYFLVIQCKMLFPRSVPRLELFTNLRTRWKFILLMLFGKQQVTNQTISTTILP